MVNLHEPNPRYWQPCQEEDCEQNASRRIVFSEKSTLTLEDYKQLGESALELCDRHATEKLELMSASSSHSSKSRHCEGQTKTRRRSKVIQPRKRPPAKSHTKVIY